MWRAHGLERETSTAPPIAPIARCEVAAVAVLTVVAAWMRLRHLGALSQSGDEGFTYLAVRGVLEHGIPRLPSGAVYWKSLLYTYLATAAVAPCGAASSHVDALLRLPAALASTALVPASWWTGRRLFTPAVGLAAATIVTGHLWQIEMSRSARYYPVLQLALMGLVERFHAVHALGRRRARGALWACFAAALATHTIALTFLLLYVPLVAFRGPRWLRDRRNLAEVAALAALALAWLAFESRWEVGFVHRPSGAAFGAVSALTKSLGRWSAQFFRWLPVLVPSLVWMIGIAGPLWALTSLRPAARRGGGSGGAAALVLAMTLVLAIALLGFGAAHAVPRYLFHLLPFGVLLAAAVMGGAGGAVGAWFGGDRGARFGSLAGACAAALVGVADAHVADALRVADRTHADRVEDGRYLPSIEVLFTWDTAGTGRYVAEHRAPDDRVLGTHPIFTFGYAGRLDGWVWRANPALWDAFHEGPDGHLVDNYVGARVIRTLAELRAELARPGRVWIVTTPSLGVAAHVDPAIARYLAQHVEARVFEGRDGVSAVYRFDATAPAPLTG